MRSVRGARAYSKIRSYKAARGISQTTQERSVGPGRATRLDGSAQSAGDPIDLWGRDIWDNPCRPRHRYWCSLPSPRRRWEKDHHSPGWCRDIRPSRDSRSAFSLDSSSHSTPLKVMGCPVALALPSSVREPRRQVLLDAQLRVRLCHETTIACAPSNLAVAADPGVKQGSTLFQPPRPGRQRVPPTGGLEERQNSVVKEPKHPNRPRLGRSRPPRRREKP